MELKNFTQKQSFVDSRPKNKENDVISEKADAYGDQCQVNDRSDICQAELERANRIQVFFRCTDDC